MKTVIRSAIAIIAMVALSSSAAVLPAVGNGTEPNKWTRNMSGVLNAAKTTNLPILLVMINDSSSGEGCAHCMQFVTRTLNTQNFANIVSTYSFYMVLLNRWSSPSEPNYGGVDYSVWSTYFNRYQAGDSGYPQVVVIRPDGTRYRGWSYETRPVSTSGTVVYQSISQAIAELSPLGTTLSLSSQSGDSVYVEQTAAVWKGSITRSGKSGRSGSVSITVSSSDADALKKYKLDKTSIDFGTADGTKDFTITGPTPVEGIVADTLTISIAANGFDGSTVDYETQTMTVTFRDKRVAKTLTEFSGANPAFSSLSSSGVWYEPTDKKGVLVSGPIAADGTSELTWTASKGGVATLSALPGGMVSVKVGRNAFDLGEEAVTIGVGKGDVIKMTARAEPDAAVEAGTIGLKTLSFAEMTVNLSKPANGAAFSLPAVKADKSVLNLAWSSSPEATGYKVFGGDLANEVDVGTAKSANAVDIGIVSDSSAAGEVTWGVKAVKSEGVDYGVASAVATAKFLISAGPEFRELPSSVSAYLKVGTDMDFSAWAPEGTGALTYSATGLPMGLKIDKSTGKITGVPKMSGSRNVTVTVANEFGSATTSFTLKVTKFPTTLKGNFIGVLFNGNGGMAAEASWKVSSSGKWSAKINRDGVKTSLKGTVAVTEDGGLVISDSGFRAKRAVNSSLWTGSWSGLSLYGKTKEKLDSTWSGVWTCGVQADGNDAFAGGLVVKVAANGKASLSGKVNANKGVAASGTMLVLSEATVKSYLPRWAGNGNVAFMYGWKRKSGVVFNGGMAFGSNGKLLGAFTLDGVAWSAEGSKWDKKQLLSSLDGAMVAADVIDGFAVKVIIGRKLQAQANNISAKISATQSTGLFKGSFNTDSGRAKFQGELFFRDGVLVGFGGGNVAGTPFAITIGK